MYSFLARSVTNLDIKRLASEEALLKSEQRLKYHLENSPLAVVEWDKDFNILQWSEEAEHIFGLKKENVIGVRIDSLNIIYEEDLPVVASTMKRLTSGKELKVVSKNRNYSGDRSIIDCVWYNSVLLDENGNMSSVLSLIDDVTLLGKTEKELRESRENYKELIS